MIMKDFSEHLTCFMIVSDSQYIFQLLENLKVSVSIKLKDSLSVNASK